MKKLLTALAFVSALAPAAAFAGPSDSHRAITPAPVMAPAPVRPVAPALPAIAQRGAATPARLALARYTQDVQDRVASAEAALRGEVARGRVRAAALREFSLARANVERTLRAASSDGSISRRERASIDGLLDQLEQVGASYRLSARRR